MQNLRMKDIRHHKIKLGIFYAEYALSFAFILWNSLFNINIPSSLIILICGSILSITMLFFMYDYYKN